MNSPLAEAVGLTEEMVATAKRGDWPRVGRLQEQRSQLLKPDLYTHADAQDLLPRLKALQQELSAIIATTRGDVRRKLLQSQRASAAASAYLDAARD